METAVSRKYLAGKAFPQDTRKTFCFARVSYLIHTSVPTLYIPSLPTNDKECFREKTLATTLESQRLSLPTIFYIITCGFSSTPTSPFSYPGKVDSSNTYHTILECSMKFRCCWEVLEEAKDGKCNMELVAGSEELDKTQFREALLEQELGGLRYIEQIRLRRSLANPCIPTDCLVD